jgi:hypothetical protein
VDIDDPILGNKANQIAIVEHILGRASKNATEFNAEEVDTFLHDESINFIDCTETTR